MWLALIAMSSSCSNSVTDLLIVDNDRLTKYGCLSISARVVGATEIKVYVCLTKFLTGVEQTAHVYILFV